MSEQIELKNHLDKERRLTHWPSKRSVQEVALDYLATKFEAGKVYSEKDVTTLLNQLHTFNDAALLRRNCMSVGC